MHGTRLRWTAVLLAAAAVIAVTWTRLRPLGLHGLDDRAAAEVRDRLAGARHLDDAAVEAWIAEHPERFARKVAATRDRIAGAYTYRAEDGRDHVYLGDLDSYLWLRRARQYLRAGTTCDTVVQGDCRDLHTLAPIGGSMRYARSIHIAAIVAVHRIGGWLRPGWPLPSSAMLVPVVVGALGVLPAFALGRRVAGDAAGLCAAIVSGTNAVFLGRSIGGDDDVWNVVLPLAVVWAVAAGLGARRPIACAGFAVLAAGIQTVHALSWRGALVTWGVVVGALALDVAVSAARALAPRHRAAATDALRRASLALVVFCLAGLGLAALRGESSAFLRVPLDAVTALVGPGHAPAPSGEHWPDTLATVSELSHSGLAGIANGVGGALFCFVGWLGLLLLVLPRRGWGPAHFAVLIAGTLLYRGLLAAPEMSRAVLLGLVALPLVAALVVSIGEDDDDEERGTRLLVVVWFLATFLLAWAWVRFTILLVAPFALAFGVALGRLTSWIEQVAGAWRPAARVAGWFVVAAVLVTPLRNGLAVADAYLPRMQDAWWDGLIRLRGEAPEDAVVVAWWDYGYFVEYVADRGSVADGSTLLTHAPHWIARALLAQSERESAGLLRMLACGSDATPRPEGARGAWGKLVARGIDGGTAHDLVVAVASLDRAAAAERLRAAGLDTAAAEDVLTSTHCTPPATYVVVSSAQAAATTWTVLGAWGGEPETLESSGDATPCRLDGHGMRRCTVRAALADSLTERFVYPEADPAAGRLVVQPLDGGRAREVAPAVVLLAAGGQVRSIEPSAGDRSPMGVLIDVEHARVVVGTPALLRSTFARLMFLGDVSRSPFEKVDERTAAGERIVTWRVRYGRTDPNASSQNILDFLTASEPLKGKAKPKLATPTVAPGNFGVPDSSLML
jgi:asparagine N-glycosylation enzyme membrane subunit Stt3